MKGNGWGLRALSSKRPNRLVAVEISDLFRQEISQLQLESRIEVYGNDAKDMKSFLKDNSVDKMMAVNVIYFLDPLPTYVKEFHRVLKPGAKALFACKYTATLGHPDIFKNKHIPSIVKTFETHGFRVRTEKVVLGDPITDYTAIEVIKNSTT